MFQFMNYLPLITRLGPEAKEVLRLSQPAIKYMMQVWPELKPHVMTIVDDEELQNMFAQIVGLQEEENQNAK